MKVYDLLNAGPRHRFMIRNREGHQMVVSNCCQGIAADVMAHGAIEAEKRGMPIYALIHDQGLAERLNGKTAEDFSAALATLPPWAMGLPLKVESKICKYYSK